jgi:hypothetical protein
VYDFAAVVWSMPLSFQITIDCASPHTLAAWWAKTLDWAVEPSNEEFIREMISRGLATEGDTEVFEGTLVWRAGAAITNTQDAATPRILFQLVPEPKTVKNRVHLDVRLHADSLTQVQEALIQRGATFLHTGQQGPHHWVTMADPEGNEFCISE